MSRRVGTTTGFGFRTGALVHLPPCRAQTSNDLVLPVQNYTNSIILGFGQPNPSYGNELHVAEDIAAAAGTPVQAAGTGRVMLARPWKSCPNWGYILVMEHTLANGSKISTVYGHLDPTTVTVSEGQTVVQGALLGRIGTYTCWQDHLHFGIRVGAFGSAVGVYPSWLAGYLLPADFPATYCEPSTFVRNGVCAFFNCEVDFLRVIGNINGGAGFADAFNDGSLTASPTSFITCNLNTAPVSESGGFLHLTSADGANTFTPGAIVDNCFLGLDASTYRFNKGLGGATITVSFRADAPLPQQAYGLQLFTLGTDELVSIFVTNNGAGPVIGALTKTAAGTVSVDNVALDLSGAQRVFLRLTYNDSTSQVTQSFSTNGTTLTSVSVSQPGTVMTTGSQALTAMFGSVQLSFSP